MISHINLNKKRTGKPTALNLHGGFDEAGIGNVTKETTLEHAPILDPTEESFKEFIVVTLINSNTITVDNSRREILTALEQQDLQKFCAILEVLFANVPYTLHIKKESYYHSIFQFLLSFLALEVQSEVMTA